MNPRRTADKPAVPQKPAMMRPVAAPPSHKVGVAKTPSPPPALAAETTALENSDDYSVLQDVNTEDQLCK